MWVQDRKILPWEIPMVSLSFLKNDLEKVNRKLRQEYQKLCNQFLPTFIKAVSGHHAQQPSKLSILNFGFELDCNVSNMQYIIHKM